MPRYDQDNSGAIDKDEMVNVMKSIYSMVDGNVSEANRGSTKEKVNKGNNSTNNKFNSSKSSLNVKQVVLLQSQAQKN